MVTGCAHSAFGLAATRASTEGFNAFLGSVGQEWNLGDSVVLAGLESRTTATVVPRRRIRNLPASENCAPAAGLETECKGGKNCRLHRFHCCPRRPKPSQKLPRSPTWDTGSGGTSLWTRGSASPFGDEIRPALPITTSDPVGIPGAARFGGNVVVEITMTNAEKSFVRACSRVAGPRSTTKSWQRWRIAFSSRHPKRVAIASKQDAIFHFKARG